MFTIDAWPTNFRTITQRWGARPAVYKRFGWAGGHEGIDFMAPMGSPIYAVAGGVVKAVRNTRRDGRPSAYGWQVVIEHNEGYETIYAHLAEDVQALTKPGIAVRAGQIIGYSGNTGNSDGAHLHFSLKRTGARTPGFPPKYIDPTPFIRAFLSRPPRKRPTSHITKEQIL